MNAYTVAIRETLRLAGTPANAGPMKAYMKNRYEFLGIKAPERRALTKLFLSKKTLPVKDDIWEIIYELWQMPEREFQYFAMDLILRYNRLMEESWLDHYEFMIMEKSWWDTVDFIAVNLAGNYFMKFPHMIGTITGRWMHTGNIWLQRSCLLFQLKYKKNTDTTLLSSFISDLSGSGEFFISKAIGWILREYSKTDPVWVRDFVLNQPLQSLSRKEALRRIPAQ